MRQGKILAVSALFMQATGYFIVYIQKINTEILDIHFYSGSDKYEHE